MTPYFQRPVIRSVIRPTAGGAGFGLRTACCCLLVAVVLQTQPTRAAEGGERLPAAAATAVQAKAQPARATAPSSAAVPGALGEEGGEHQASGKWRRRFSGRWAMLQILTTVSELPVLGRIYAKTRVVTLHELQYREQRLAGKGKLCRMLVDSGTARVKTVLPKAFLRSLPRPVFDAALFSKGGRWVLRQGRRHIVVGARLRDRVVGSLPTDAGDPRVVDQDADGRPGVTIRIDGLVKGDIYVTQRNWSELTGELRAPGRFEGRIEFGNEQNILGATSWVLKHPPRAKPVPDRSHFHLVRMRKNARCDEALQLFNLGISVDQ